MFLQRLTPVAGDVARSRGAGGRLCNDPRAETYRLVSCVLVATFSFFDGNTSPRSLTRWYSIGGGFTFFFEIHPYLGKIPISTIFQMG